MALHILTDADAIVARLDAMTAVDPVRHTVLGTIATILRSGQGDGWGALESGTEALAVRSEPTTPLAVTSGWADPTALAAALAALPTVVSSLTGPVEAVDALAPLLCARPSVRARRTAERLFRLDELTVPAVAGIPRPAGITDRALLREWFAAFGVEARDRVADPALTVDRALAWGRVWLWRDETGRPVSVAARRAPAAGSARIGPVYTPPEHRGRGYGSAVTAAATRDILALGAVPVLFTDLANPVSNAIYQRLGYRPVGDYAHVDLLPPLG